MTWTRSRLSGFSRLIEEKIRNPIGGTWSWRDANFRLPSQARNNIFGNYVQIYATALDMARLGWLWLNWGRWQDRQVVSESWSRQATQVASDIIAGSPREEWRYG